MTDMRDMAQREQHVAGLVCQRLDDEQIARQLYVDTSTVTRHVANLINALEANDRDHLIEILERDHPDLLTSP